MTAGPPWSELVERRDADRREAGQLEAGQLEAGGRVEGGAAWGIRILHGRAEPEELAAVAAVLVAVRNRARRSGVEEAIGPDRVRPRWIYPDGTIARSWRSRWPWS